MAVQERQTPVLHCCSYCCRAEDFGTHDYCGGNSNCDQCPDDDE